MSCGVLQKVKDLESRILYLEGLSPEYSGSESQVRYLFIYCVYFYTVFIFSSAFRLFFLYCRPPGVLAIATRVYFVPQNKGRFCKNSEIDSLISKRLSLENKAKLSPQKV